MRVRQIAPVVGVLGILPALYLCFPRADLADGLGDFRSWKPSEIEIARSVGKGPGAFNDARHVLFAQLFQQRFRNHSYAIGLKFITPTCMKAMFAPIIPRWDMARVAVDARRQARDVFGMDYDVDVYETYVSAPMIKIGELRDSPSSDRPAVRFDPRFAVAEFEAMARAAAKHPARRTSRAIAGPGAPPRANAASAN